MVLSGSWTKTRERLALAELRSRLPDRPSADPNSCGYINNFAVYIRNDGKWRTFLTRYLCTLHDSLAEAGERSTMARHDTETDSCSVGKPIDSREFEPVSSRRYTVGPDEQVTVAIVCAVAAAKDVAPTELDQRLNDVVDADALQRLFASSDDGLTATFFLDGYRVTVFDGGEELIVSEE